MPAPINEDDPGEQEQEIVEKVNYLTTVLIPSIRAINNAIENDKPSRGVAKNLITDLLHEWRDEIKSELQNEEDNFQKIRLEQNKYLAKGTTAHQKLQAQKEINLAEQDYARNVKAIVIQLIHKYIGLFQTRKKIEHGYLSLAHLCEPEEIDE